MGSMANGINDVVEDRLSEMPDEVIIHILSCMPTIDAVKTMLLRRFGQLWTLVPALRFDFDEYYYKIIDEFSVDDQLSVIPEMLSWFSRRVENVLTRHRRSTIDTFHVYMNEFEFYFEDPEMIDVIQMWLRFAVSKGVKDLHFAYHGADEFAPTRCVFTCQSLAALTLSGFMIEKCDDERPYNMGASRKLSLRLVQGCNDAFNQLISGCPSLEELILDNPLGLRVLNITAPSVSKLYLYLRDLVDDPVTLHCPYVKVLDLAIFKESPLFQLHVTDVSSLQVVNVKDLPDKCWRRLVKTVVKQFRNVSNFSWSRTAFKKLSLMKKVNFPQNSWNRLVLQPCWNDERCLDVILKLLKSSAKLEELIIDVEQSSEKRELLSSELCTCRQNTQKTLLYPELSTDCVYPLLITITILGYENCCKGLLELVEVLLRNAVILEKLVITIESNRRIAVEEHDFVKKVSSFTRASTNAIVVFA